jgi:glycosyltransferase involved in cell wall biosynthesis
MVIMKIAQLMPGSGNAFYCENCLRDTSIILELQKQGHQSLVVPLYLPIESEEPQLNVPVFFGGINVYLQQKSSLFRKTPRWLDKLFDAPFLLRMAGKRSGMTQASELAEMTLSMLLGEEGNQSKEVDRVTKWLKESGKPDLVQFSNALLLGMAHQIKEELKVPLLCLLQDEDIWLDAMPDPIRKKLWDTMSEKAKEIDAFISVSEYYKQQMVQRLGIPPEKIHVVYTGIQTGKYKQSTLPHDPPVIGYLERQCKEKGLEVLAKAYATLKKDDRFKSVRLRVAGGMTPGDEPFVNGIKRYLRQAGVIGDVEFLPNLEIRERIEFLSSLTVLSVPAEHKEAFGVYVIEALASGVPVVQPNHGAFTELMNILKGGIIYEPNEPSILAKEMGSLLLNPERVRELGDIGKKAVVDNFRIEDTTRKFVKVITSIVNGT